MPVGPKRRPAPDVDALTALPLVGAAIGWLAGCAGWLVSKAAPQPLAVATAFAAPIVLSGAIHIDGFLDCSDAVFASVPPERRLEILKDPRHGTYAVTAMALFTVSSLAALAACRPAAWPAILAYSGALARLAAISNALRYGPAPGKEVTRAFERRPSAGLLATEAVAVSFLALALKRRTWLTVPLSFVLAQAGGSWLARKLGGGLAGDAYGFIIVCLEPCIVAVAGARR